MRNAPFTKEQENDIYLKKQERVIMSVLLYGTSEEQNELSKAESDIQLHPVTKGLIQKCRSKVQIYTQRTSDTEATSIKEQVRSNRAAA